jgi:formate-dependent phosphoribosylglycinamide formyltransferase (GAR transformylase)
MSNKKALLVGSSFSAAPILFVLKKYGIKVSVCGNTLSDPCHQYADDSFYVDYSNPDELMSVVESNKFDFLVPTCNDLSYMSCAKIVDKYNFPGFDSLEVSRNLHIKDAFRIVTKNLSIPAPQYNEIINGQQLDCPVLRFPLLVKPVDSFSGRGMVKIDTIEEIPRALELARKISRSKKVILEEFVEGSLHSHSAFLQDGRIKLDFFVDEYCTVYPYQVNCSNHPSSLSEHIRNGVRNSINLIASSLGLCDGLIHTQFIADKSNFWIIETMRRCPGDLYGSLINFATGIDFMDHYVRPFIGMRLPISEPQITSLFYARHTISVKQPLVYFSFSQNIPSERVDFVGLKGSGEKLGIAPFDKLGILFAQFKDKKSMISVTPSLADFISIKDLGVKYV